MPLALIPVLQQLVDVFHAVLVFIHETIGTGWGLSIVLLTVVVRAALVPLTLRQFKSMQALQRLQPEMKALQAKYKGDKQKLNEEMMKFYRENKVNPLGSCLPLVLQFPVLISLYFMLRTDLRHDICPTYAAAHANILGCGVPPPPDAGFLFIPDLTQKATGAVLVVLIILYIGSQVGSSLMMSTAATDKTQRNIMLFLPVIFVFFIISFPAGLIVYWITTNFWTVGQQYVVKRMIGHRVPAPAAASATAGKGKPALAASGDGGRKESGGNGAATGAENGSGGQSGAESRKAAPPRPPRKKKKRSGRRR